VNTIVTGLSNPPGGAALRDAASTAVTNAQALIVNNPNAKPGRWEKIKRAHLATTAVTMPVGEAEPVLRCTGSCTSGTIAATGSVRRPRPTAT